MNEWGADALAVIVAFATGSGLGSVLTWRVASKKHALEREKFEYEKSAERRAAKEAAMQAVLDFMDECVNDANEWIAMQNLPVHDRFLNQHMGGRQTNASRILRDLRFYCHSNTVWLAGHTYRCYERMAKMVVHREMEAAEELQTRFVLLVADLQDFIKKERDGTIGQGTSRSRWRRLKARVRRWRRARARGRATSTS